MEWVGHSAEELWKYKDAINIKIRLLDVLKDYRFQVENKDTGLFTHRMRCPFHQSDKTGGVEKTPSFFISDTTNTYHCFGCCRGGNVINFVSEKDGVPPVVALEQLAKRAGLIDKDGNFDELAISQVDESLLRPRETIDPYLFEIGQAMRSHIKQFVGSEMFDKELKWVEKIGKKVDEFIGEIGHEDVEYAAELVGKVKASIKKRNK